MAEKQVEQYLKKRVEALGGLCMKFVSPGRRGVCDRLVLSENGFTYYVELKYGKNTLSPAQVLFKGELEKRSTVMYVLASKEEVDKFIEEIYL
jgi:hypothetical protein